MTERIDPELLDFIPSQLDHSDGELIDACRRLVNKKAGELLAVATFVAKEYKLGRGTSIGLHGDRADGVIILHVPDSSSREFIVAFFGMDQVIFATCTCQTNHASLSTADPHPDAWMALNFKECIQRLDTIIAQGRKVQSAQHRTKQAAAVTALRRGKAVLA